MKQDFVYDYSKLRGRIREVLGSQDRLAEAMGYTNVSLSRKMNNKQNFSMDDIIHMVYILDIPKEEIGEYFYKVEGEM